MNEKIKQLWEQAAKTTQGDSWEEQTKFMERFAELIVRECLKQVSYTREDVINGNISEVIKNRMKQHFGVDTGIDTDKKINIAELKKILADVELCMNYADANSWISNPDRMGGQFTQDEIDESTRWR